MGKELCFVINNEKIYLEKVLVEYMGVPIFFVCKGIKFYVVLCTDLDVYNYYVVPVSEKELFGLLHQIITMREIFSNQKSFYEIISGENGIDGDFIEEKSIDQIDYTVLPESGAYFEVLTDDIQKYVNEFDEKYFGASEYGEIKVYNVDHESESQNYIYGDRNYLVEKISYCEYESISSCDKGEVRFHDGMNHEKYHSNIMEDDFVLCEEFDGSVSIMQMRLSEFEYWAA